LPRWLAGGRLGHDQAAGIGCRAADRLPGKGRNRYGRVVAVCRIIDLVSERIENERTFMPSEGAASVRARKYGRAPAFAALVTTATSVM
jgi:hypothetical protein